MSEEQKTSYWAVSMERASIYGGHRTFVGDFVVATKSDIPNLTGLTAHLLEEGGVIHHQDPTRIDSISDAVITQQLFFADDSTKVWRVELTD
jgi:hypothetical protein